MFMDGTFGVCPKGIYQLFSMHVIMGDHDHQKAIPLLYGLFTRKTKNFYQQFFRWFKEFLELNHIPLCWKRVTCDYETGLLPALALEFEVDLALCLYHHNAALLRYAYSIGLKAAYEDKTSNVVRSMIRLVMALAFLPINHR